MPNNDFWQSDDRSKGRRVPVYGGRRPSPTLSSRVRAATGMPEAVVKVGKFYRTLGRVKQALQYQSREGSFEVELKDGTILTKDDGIEALNDLAEQWSANFSARKDARNASHIIISTPAGMDPKAVLVAARAWGQRILAPHYDYAFTLHTDEPHPHVHFLVVREGSGSKRLGWSRAELDEFRIEFAKEARQQGLELNATPRFSRGQFEKSESQRTRKARERLGSSISDEGAAEEVLAGLATRQRGDQKTWFEAMQKRAKQERDEYEALAQAFKRIASRMDEDPGSVVETTAKLLAKQSLALRTIISRRRQMEKIAQAAQLKRVKDRNEAAKVLAKLYRAERQDRADAPKLVVPVQQKAILKQLEAFDARAGRQIRALAEHGDEVAVAVGAGVSQLIERNKEIER